VLCLVGGFKRCWRVLSVLKEILKLVTFLTSGDEYVNDAHFVSSFLVGVVGSVRF
jgi:hypothetical protein